MSTKLQTLIMWTMALAVVLIGAGCHTSRPSSATPPSVDVGLAPKILQQPQTQIVPPNGTAIFTVIATNVGIYSADPIYYQWHFNGADLAGATSSTLVITEVSEANVGAYNVTVKRNSKRIFQRTSATAFLILGTAGSLTIPVKAFTDVPSTKFGSTFTMCHNMDTNLFADAGALTFIVDTLDSANAGLDTGLEIWQRKNVAVPPLPKVVKVNDNYNSGTKLSRTQIPPLANPYFYNIAVYLRGSPPPSGNVIVMWSFH